MEVKKASSTMGFAAARKLGSSSLPYPGPTTLPLNLSTKTPFGGPTPMEDACGDPAAAAAKYRKLVKNIKKRPSFSQRRHFTFCESYAIESHQQVFSFDPITHESSSRWHE